MSLDMLPKTVNKIGGDKNKWDPKNIQLIIKLLKNNKNHPPNYFTNKEIRNYHYQNNLLFRLIFCYSSYVCPRIDDKPLFDVETDLIWNFSKETVLFKSYVTYCLQKLKEDPLPGNNLVFLLQFFLFCVEEKQIRNVCFLISDKPCQNFIGNNVTKLVDHIKQAQINKHNNHDIEDVILTFCIKYAQIMLTTLIFLS